MAKAATVIITDMKTKAPERFTFASEKYIESVLNVADDIKRKGRQGKSVVSISWGERRESVPAAFMDILRTYLPVSP